MKEGAYAITLDEKKCRGTRWVLLSIDRHTTVLFNVFEIEYIPQEVLNKIKDKSITHNIFRILDNESVRCDIYFIAFIEYILAGKNLLDYINLFSTNDYKKNDKIIYTYLKDKYERRSKSGFCLRWTDETSNCLLYETKYNDLMSQKYKKAFN